MSPLLVRILLAIIMIPLAAMVYFSAFLKFQELITPFFALVWGGAATALFVVLWWLSLWRSSVCWTTLRKWGTFLAGPVAIVIGSLGGLVSGWLARYRFEPELAAFLGSVLAILVWLVLTVLIWRETAAERLEQLAKARGEILLCPKCGYNMVGLHEARCPECGTQFTLDQLHLAQQRPQIADAASPQEKPV